MIYKVIAVKPVAYFKDFENVKKLQFEFKVAQKSELSILACNQNHFQSYMYKIFKYSLSSTRESNNVFHFAMNIQHFNSVE